MNPRTYCRAASLTLMAILALPASICLAQEKSQPESNRLIPVDPNVISIDFPGGPLSKLVASFASQKDTNLSIIQSEGLDPTLPAFSVREVRADFVLLALGQILEPQGYILRPVGPNVAVLSKIEPGFRGSQGFASFQLESKIGAREGRTADEVIAAIQTACEFANPGQKSSTLRFKYHPGTKLLFVAGSQQEIHVAHQVFGSLPDSAGIEPPSSDEK